MSCCITRTVSVSSDPFVPPNYKYLSDADKKNAFDVERYIRAQRKKKRTPAVVAPEEPFDLYDIDLSDMNMAAEESGE